MSECSTVVIFVTAFEDIFPIISIEILENCVELGGNCVALVPFSLLEEFKDNPEEFNVNCVDPLNRSALIASIENENIDLIKILLEYNIEVNDALLHAISEEYVEGVELLLYHEETHHESGKPYVSITDAALTTFKKVSTKKNGLQFIKHFNFSHGKQSIVHRRHLHLISHHLP